MFEGNCGIPYSLAVAPISSGNNGGNGNGMFGGDGWWAIIIFALIFGWGGFGGWGNGGGGSVATQSALTRGDLCNEFSFNDLQNGVRNVNDSVNLGFANLNSTICHQQYDTAMLINGVTGAVNNGFSALNSTICQQQYDTANMLNQMNMTNMQNANAANVVALQNANALERQIADCCCENRAAVAQNRYDMAQNTCAITNAIQTTTRDIIDNQNAGTRAVIDKLCQMEYNGLNDKYQAALAENQTLRFAASQDRQNALLTTAMVAQTNQIIDRISPQPVPAFPVNPPFPYTGFGAFGNGYGYGNSCCGNC